MDRRKIRSSLGARAQSRYDNHRTPPTIVDPFNNLYQGMTEARIDKEIDVEVEQVAKSKKASLSVSQALEKAKSLVEGTVLSQESYHDVLNQVDDRDRYPFTIALVEHEIRVADRQAAVNVIDEIDGPFRGELSFPSEFPAGELPSNESGTSEHDFPGTRRVEGQSEQEFQDVASPQQLAEYDQLMVNENYEDAWELLKEVSQQADQREGEIGNSLIDLTTEKWGSHQFLTLEEINAGLVPCGKRDGSMGRLQLIASEEIMQRMIENLAISGREMGLSDIHNYNIASLNRKLWSEIADETTTRGGLFWAERLDYSGMLEDEYIEVTDNNIDRLRTAYLNAYKGAAKEAISNMLSQ